MLNEDFNNFLSIVISRKSVRKFSNQEVEDQSIKAIMEAARTAPSWQNKQCWEFIVIKQKEKIKEIANACGIFNKWLENSHCIIIACGDPAKSGNRDGLPYFMVDVAIAMEHLILAATALGFGTCWVGYFDEIKIKNICKIPEKIRVVALTPIGKPENKEEAKKIIDFRQLILNSTRRKKLEEFTHYENW